MREGEAGRDPTEIICRFFCVPGEGLDVARFMFAAYGTVPVYEAFFRALGWGDAIDPMVAAWREGDRKAARLQRCRMSSCARSSSSATRRP